MKIILLIAEHGFAFINQAIDLGKGLTGLGIKTLLLKIANSEVPLITIKKFNPDLILSIGSWESYPFLVEQTVKAGYRTIPWIVADYPINNFAEEYNKLGLILTPSNHCRNNLISGGINQEVIKVLPEAVDHNFWKPISEREKKFFLSLFSLSISNSPKIEIPLKFDLIKAYKEKIPLMLTMGGDVTSKGAQEVFRALGLVKQNFSSWIYILKTWPSKESFELSAKELELVKKEKIEENIIYNSGHFSQKLIRGLINICNIYVSPSRKEGFGLPLVQAMMCEKPVITCRGTSTEEIVKNGETGWIVKSEIINNEAFADVEDLARSLERLLSDDLLREKMGKLGRKYAFKSFSPNVVAKTLISYIKKYA